MPNGFFGRTADRWRALFAIADSVGCGDQAREAAKVLSNEHQDEDLKVTLLNDIRTAFGVLADDQLTSDMLLQCLLTLGDEHWAEFRGENNDQAPKPLTRPTMAKLLSPFGIRTCTIWPRNRSAGSKSQRGYNKSQFERVWANYCGETNTPTQSSNIRRLKWP
jgi:hypothetical protein